MCMWAALGDAGTGGLVGTGALVCSSPASGVSAVGIVVRALGDKHDARLDITERKPVTYPR
jgi:hypothetical protein